jgi:hypothetical protein
MLIVVSISTEMIEKPDINGVDINPSIRFFFIVFKKSFEGPIAGDGSFCSYPCYHESNKKYGPDFHVSNFHDDRLLSFFVKFARLKVKMHVSHIL